MSGKVWVTFECERHDDLARVARDILESMGFTVEKKAAGPELREKESPAQFARRHGIHPGSFSRTLRHPDCPGDYQIRRGRTGRKTLWIRSSPRLEEFMRDNVKLNTGGSSFAKATADKNGKHNAKLKA